MAAKRLGVLLGLALLAPWDANAGDSPSYVIEAPDLIRIDVAGLPRKVQPVRGERLVRPDGKVSLGAYGDVRVHGLSLDRARAAILEHLAPFVKRGDRLQVWVEVAANNSKWHYVVHAGENGGHISKLPSTGAETVSSAILSVEGLASDALKGHVWVARPSGKVQKVDWPAIVQEGRLATNYRLEAGDRVHVGGSPPQ